MNFRLFYSYVKTNGCYPDFDRIRHPASLFRVALSHAEGEAEYIFNKRSEQSGADILNFDRDILLGDMATYLGDFYDLDECYVSAYWDLICDEFDGITNEKDLSAMRASHKLELELMPQVIEFIPFHEVREAISSMRQMTDNGFFDVLGTHTYKADSMRDEMLRNMETVMRFIYRYRRA